MTERTVGKSAWFVARVIDNKDPTESGRNKIRVMGLHDDETNVSDDHLTWAKTVMPSDSASLGGLGTSPTGMQPNTMVFGVWLDKDRTIPMIMGSVHGASNTQSGSTSGSQSSSGGTTIDPSTVNDVNPLVRTTATQGGIDETYTNSIESGVQKHTAQFMPNQTYASKVQYPDGHVRKTKSGHEIFINDTPGSEAIRITHKSGSVFEMTADGKVVMRSTGSTHNVSDSDSTFKGDGNHDSKLKGNSTGEIGGNQTSTVAGNQSSNVGGNKETKVAGSQSTEVQKDIQQTSTQGNITQTAQNGSMNLSATQGMSMGSGTSGFTMTPDGAMAMTNGSSSVQLTPDGTVNIASSGPVNITGSSLTFNGTPIA